VLTSAVAILLAVTISKKVNRKEHKNAISTSYALPPEDINIISGISEMYQSRYTNGNR
jgi:hypothetical protein